MNHLLCILARKSRSQLLHASSKQCQSQDSASCYCCQVLKGEITTYFVQYTNLLEAFYLDGVLAGIEIAQQTREEYLKMVQSYLKIPLSESVRKICTLSFLAKVKFATAFI